MTPAKLSFRFRNTAVLLVLATVSALALSVWLTFRPTRDQLLEQGLAQLRRDPIQAERTLRRILNDTRGHDVDAAIALSRLMLHRSAFDKAVELYAGLDPAKCRIDLLLAFGKDALKTPLRTQALQSLGIVVNADSHDRIPAMELLMADYREWGQRQKQLEVATMLTRAQPENSKAWMARVELLTGASDTEAIDVIREAMKTAKLPTDVQRNLQGLLVQQLANRGDAGSARRELDELIQMEGESARARGLQVDVLRLEGELERALDLATSIVNDSPRMPGPRFARGVLLLELKRFAEAVTELERVEAARPFDVPTHLRLAEAYRHLDREDQATKQQETADEIAGKQKRISALLKSREENPLNVETYQELEALHRELGDVEAARTWHQWVERAQRANQLASPKSNGV